MFGVDDLAVATMAAPLIGGLFGIGTNKANAEQNEAQRQWQSRENELSRNFTQGENAASRSFTAYENKLSRDWQEKMWNAQNQYNTPSAMMARYKEAGLNPFLAGMSQIGQGAGSAGTPATSSSAPMSGSASMGSPGSPIPMQNPFPADALLNAAGVSANIANQHARTQQQKWETYQFIRNHVGSDASKKYLDANPDMFQSSDPDNDPWMRAYHRSEVRENLDIDRNNWEYNLRQMYGVKQAEKEIYRIDTLCNDLNSQIDKRSWDIKEIRKTLDLIDEQIRTEKSIQSRNYSESGLNRARTQTENETRQYVVKQFLLNTNILDMSEQSTRALFESKESLRGWLTSQEAKNAFATAARNHGLWDADAVRSSLLEFLDHVNIGGSFNGSYETSSSRSSSGSSYDHSVNRSGSSSTSVTY